MIVPVFLLVCSWMCLQQLPAGVLSTNVEESSNVAKRQAASFEQVVSDTLDLQTKFAEQEQQISELERERHTLLTSMFDQSAVYNGHHYLASRTYYEHIDSVENFCELFDGYLLEINDVAEHNFVRAFLDVTTYWSYLVGAVKNYNNQWEFRYSGQAVTYFDWQANMPSGENCMALSRSANWQMRDYPCVIGSASTHFVCEIPSPP